VGEQMETGDSFQSVKHGKFLDLLIPTLYLCFVTSISSAELTIESVYPTMGKLGEPLEITLQGTGFDASTRLSMYLDSGNARFIKGSLETRGYARDITIVGDKAYIADGCPPSSACDELSSLLIVDISTPSSPVTIARMDTPGSAGGIAVRDNVAYVADGETGLQIIDISTPSNPVITGSLDTAYGTAVAISGGHVYVAGNSPHMSESGLQVIDISVPNNPVIVGAVKNFDAENLTVVGDLAYVVGEFGGLQVIDISIPSDPVIIGTADVGGWPSSVAAIDDIAYVATPYAGLKIVDISTPTNPTVVGAMETSGRTGGMTVVDNTLYLAIESGLQIIDIVVPEYPVIIGSVETPDNGQDLTIVGNNAYLVTHTFIGGHGSSLQIIDIGTPASSQVLLGSVDSAGYAFDIDVAGDKAYVADGSGGLQVVDISTPADPLILGSAESLDQALDVVVIGNLAFMASRNWGFRIFDLSTASSPTLVGGFNSIGMGLTVVGDLAYLIDQRTGDHFSTIQIIDVSEPSEPVVIGFVNTSGYAQGITVMGDTAYVASQGTFASAGGLTIIDVGDPTNPVIISSVETFWQAMDVAVVNDTAYVLDGSEGLLVIDVSTPSSPAILKSFYTLRAAVDIVIVGDRAYLADQWEGVQVLDITTPSDPVIVGVVGTSGNTQGVSVVDDIAYVADGDAGLAIVPLPIETSPVTVHGSTRATAILPSPQLAGHYSLRVFNANEFDELPGAVSFNNNALSKAVIVAGGGPYPGNNLWPATLNSANYAYQSLLYQGYTRENIYYLNPDVGIDADGDGEFNDIDAIATSENLEYALTQWVLDETDPAHDLVFYVVNHGGDSAFRLNQNTTLSAETIDGWLDQLQQDLPGRVIMIYDACESGTFLPNVLPPPGKERLMISSAAIENAYFVNGGSLSFSYQFWASVVSSGGNLYDSFLFGQNMMSQFQTPLLDANHNGVANEAADIQIAKSVILGRGYSPPSDIPLISFVSDPHSLNGETSATLMAWGLIDDPGIERVWGVLTPPGFVSDSTDTPVTELPTVELLDPDGDNRWEGTYNDFTVEGAYEITIFAENLLGNYSSPTTPFINRTEVTQLKGLPSVDLSVSALSGSLGQSVSFYGHTESDITDWEWDFGDGQKGEGENAVHVYSEPGVYTVTLVVSGPAGDNRVVKEALVTVQDEMAFAEDKAIVVLGGENSARNSMWEESAKAAYYAYETLLHQGYSRDDIFFLSADMNVDLDGDGMFNDIDSETNLTNLEYAITGWARDPLAPANQLLVYIIGQGEEGKLKLRDNITLSSATLGDWLDEVQQDLPGGLIVIYDASQSGTFVGDLEVSSEINRLVITSASTETAYFLNEGGLSFSYQFWASVFLGGDVYDAFIHARNMMQDYQTPLLEANGNGLANEKEDKALASKVLVGAGYQSGSDRPFIQSVSGSQTLNGETSATLSASGIIDATGIVQVWAVILPPGINNNSQNPTITKLPTVDLTDPDQDNIWEGDYDDFSIEGEYRIAFYAINKNGFYATPAEIGDNTTTVTQTIGRDPADQVYSVDTSANEPITGLWWNKDESGWGVSLTQQYGIIFVTIFTYDEDGLPTWYVASNCTITANQCNGILYAVSGGSAIDTEWDGTNKITTTVGDVSIEFSDDNNAIMYLTVDGVTAEKVITRQLFSVLSPGAPMSALWWNENESGWGVTLTQQTDIAFVTLFTYNSNGFPAWYVASNCIVIGVGCTGDLYEVTGGSAISDKWNGANKIVSQVGNISFEFSASDKGKMSFEINGVNGSKDIAVQVWATQ
jgi:PKD repeat protein